MSLAIVSTPAAFLAALNAATAGGTILLAPGPWAPVTIYGYHAPGGGVVTIRSQDPVHPAVFSGFAISASSGLTVDQVTFATDLVNIVGVTAAPTPFRVDGSQRITLSNLSVHGTLDGNPQDDVNCLRIDYSDQVAVKTSEFQQCYNAITELSNTHVTISGNAIHDIRNDGIDNGGSSFVTVSGNHFSDFYPVGLVGSTGDHADAIQFWTTGTLTPAHDIAITGNTFVRGKGHWIQGIFVTDQLGLRFQNLTITGNVINGAEYNGLMVSGCSTLTIGGNVVQPYTDEPSWVRVEQCTASTVTDNKAGAFRYASDQGLSQSANTVVPPVSVPGVSAH